MTAKHFRQEVYEFWKANSIASVHRSNDRQGKDQGKNIKQQARDFTDTSIYASTKTKIAKKEAHRMLVLHH